MQIQFSKISKSYTGPSADVQILHDVDLHIKDGEFVAVMWPSGSGKTTFLNLIAGLISPTSWSIHIWETDISTYSPDEMTLYRGQHMWFVFQQFNLLPDLTVSENIDLVIDINKIPRRRETVDILEKVWLWGRGDAYPGQLSGWEQQRVALARAFVWQTSILLADEPTGNLDQETATNIMQLMIELHQQTKNTIVMITHDQDIADYADRIYRLRGKRLEKSEK